MSIFNPLDLLFFNFLFPVVIIFSKNIYIDMICFSFGVIILMLHKRYLRLVKFLIVYLIFQLLYYVLLKFSSLFVVNFATFLYIFIKMFPIFMITSVIVNDLKIGEILSALNSIKLNKNIMLGFTVAIRFIPTYKKEIKMIKESMKMRGIKLSLRHPIKFMEYLMVPVLFRASAISEEMTAAAITKSIEFPKRRSSVYNIKFRLRDFILMFGIVVLFTVLLIKG